MIYGIIAACTVCLAILFLMVHLENRKTKRIVNDAFRKYWK